MGVDRAYGSGEVSALKHDAARRRNIPTAEFESVMRARCYYHALEFQ